MSNTPKTSKKVAGLNEGWFQVFQNGEPLDEFEFCDPVSGSLSLRRWSVHRYKDGWVRLDHQMNPDGTLPAAEPLTAKKASELVGISLD